MNERQTSHPEERENGVLFIRNLPRDVKDKFKAWCAIRGISMTNAINNMIREVIKGKGAPHEICRPIKKA